VLAEMRNQREISAGDRDVAAEHVAERQVGDVRWFFCAASDSVDDVGGGREMLPCATSAPLGWPVVPDV